MADNFGDSPRTSRSGSFKPTEHLIFTVAADFTFASVNRVTQRVLEYTDDELLGARCQAIMRPSEDLWKTDPPLCIAHEAAREHPGSQFVWTTWSATRGGQRVWLSGSVWWDGVNQFWVEDCTVISYEQKLPMFDQPDLVDLQPPSTNGINHHAAINELGERLSSLESVFQRGLPGMPPTPAGPRKLKDKDAFVRQLKAAIESVSGEPEGDTGPHGGPSGRVTIGRMCFELKVSRNKLAETFTEFEIRRPEESFKDALNRLRDEFFSVEPLSKTR